MSEEANATSRSASCWLRPVKGSCLHEREREREKEKRERKRRERERERERAVQLVLR